MSPYDFGMLSNLYLTDFMNNGAKYANLRNNNQRGQLKGRPKGPEVGVLQSSPPAYAQVAILDY
jgi:hypothetical protein